MAVVYDKVCMSPEKELANRLLILIAIDRNCSQVLES